MKVQKLKSMALASLAALSFAAPMAIATPASAHDNRGGRQERYDRDHDNRGGRHDRRDRDYDNRDDRRDERRAYRDGYREGRHEWRRGDRADYRERQYWREVNYREHNYRAPPRGYHYVRDNRTGDYLLVGIATGVILGVIASR